MQVRSDGSCNPARIEAAGHTPSGASRHLPHQSWGRDPRRDFRCVDIVARDRERAGVRASEGRGGERQPSWRGLSKRKRIRRAEIPIPSPPAMGNGGAVDGHEPQALDLTLRKQHPVEGIASRRLAIDGSDRVAFIDRDDR